MHKDTRCPGADSDCVSAECHPLPHRQASRGTGRGQQSVCAVCLAQRLIDDLQDNAAIRRAERVPPVTGHRMQAPVGFADRLSLKVLISVFINIFDLIVLLTDTYVMRIY